VGDHLFGQVRGVDGHPVEAERPDPVERPVEQRHVADRAERLREVRGERAQPYPFPGGEDDPADVSHPAGDP
jgi:hypothetical protein